MSGVVTVTILNDGSIMNPEYNVMSIDIIKEVNKIPIAQIILLDGDATKREFAISNTDFFQPGNNIEIKLRYEGERQNEATVFAGIVVRHSLQADQYGSLLTVDLKDAAFKLTHQRKSAVFREMTDNEIINKIIEPWGLEITSIAATKPKHKEMVQYYCTDWDFIVSRADVNGHWVLADDGKITIQEPNLNGLPKNSFEYGISDIYEFEMSADIRHQYATVESTAWDVKTQSISPLQKAKAFSLSQGNLKAEELAKTIGADNYQLIYSGQLNDEETQIWADAKLRKSRFSMLNGRLKVPGFADIKPGQLMEIAGISKRFNGKTLVTAIRHQVNEQGWQTDIQFGLSADFFAQQNHNIVDIPAAGLVPAIHGLQIGIVENYEDDRQQQFRVKVRIPSIEKDGIIWARLASVDAGNERGIFFRPELGDEVILGFINDDPRQAIILGAVHSEKNALPPDFTVTQENNKKGIVTKKSLKILFDDEKKLIEISTPNGNSLKLSEEAQGINLVDENGNTMTMNAQGLKLESPKNITIQGKNIIIKGTEIHIN
ncbi:MAG: type VI secretion system tip protein VgrG [Nostoc sp. ZfuVER08]|uniref:Type VI secretion system tip protein VgrG n=1 Tax=Nostoc punctiforme FACHB-252 TaxID=1357509 RepID=A0ABR8H9G0_NOSPU|nr:type VI secretion system tip protein VgrG [Nostoc punctiforme]MBD2612251.1 type VI secretion system tip protein VgrG [Nostoc punctiforme FACHB-252]MDZ8015665.1 type VI secretion system tip protein VgrG [Nostoc sp. ZfuVER08]